MFKVKTSACLLVLGLAVFDVQAATVPGQGTVTFNGKLIAETCQIQSGDEDLQVTLPTLSTKTLANAGDAAGSTAFDIHVEQCDPAITKVAAHFEALNSSGFDMKIGNLTNASTSATKADEVQVRLYDADTTPITVGTTGRAFDVDATTHKATMRYFGGYYATGATTAGDVMAKVQYTLAYP